jgi:hypothetical protein
MDETERRLLAAAEEANERIRTCHERVACPLCGAPVGTRCRRVNAISSLSRAPLKHPHRQRWTLVQPAR